MKRGRCNIVTRLSVTLNVNILKRPLALGIIIFAVYVCYIIMGMHGSTLLSTISGAEKFYISRSGARADGVLGGEVRPVPDDALLLGVGGGVLVPALRASAVLAEQRELHGNGRALRKKSCASPHALVVKPEASTSESSSSTPPPGARFTLLDAWPNANGTSHVR